MRYRALGLIALVALSGCAHKLPSDEALAFKTLASANKDSFQALATSEHDAVSLYVARQLQVDKGKVAYVNCGLIAPADAQTPCAVIWTPPSGDPIELRPTAANSRALIGALASYGEQMATLAEAKDITEAQSSADGVTTSIKALATAVGFGPIAAVAIDGASWAHKTAIVNNRRRALLQAAEKADPAVELAAQRMKAIATRLKNNLVLTASTRLSDASLAIAAEQELLRKKAPGKPGDPKIIAASTAEMVKAANDLQAGRDLSTDYSALRSAHAKLISALKKPKGSTAEALADIKTFLTLLKAADTATKGA
jgi:hypothetical protein